MNMDVYTHTFFAMGSLIIAYFAGRHFSTDVENIVGTMLDRLETDGYVATKVDKNGDKELILIKDVIKDLDKS